MEQIRAVTPKTVEAFADVYQALVDKGVMISAGGAGAIRENGDLFEQIEAPFEMSGEAEQAAVTADDTEQLTETAEEMTEAAEGTDEAA